MPKRTSLFVPFFLVFLASTLVACEPNNTQLTETPNRLGEPSYDSLTWDNLQNFDGVRGFDPVGYRIGNFPAWRPSIFSGFAIYHPYDDYKQALGGTLEKFNVAEDGDWNHYIRPAAEFDSLRTRALPLKRDNWQQEEHQIQAEIKPDAEFYENPWFPKSTGSSPLEGTKIFVYGPAVLDWGHGAQPEIHPSELFWWKTRAGAGDLYWLLVIHDTSGRFNTKDTFYRDDYLEDYPNDWRPWAEAPRSARFQFAFEVNQSGPPLTFTVGEQPPSKNVSTASDPEARRDSDDGREHALEHNGRVLVRVIERQERDDNIGVRFVNAFLGKDGVVRGYVQLATEVNDNGFHSIYVYKSRESNPGTPKPSLTGTGPLMRVRIIPDSLRFTEIDGKRQLVGTMRLEIAGRQGQGRSLRPPAVSITSGNRSGSVSPKAAGDRYIALIKNVALREKATLEVSAKSGARLKFQWPGITIMPIIAERVYGQATEAQDAWKPLLSAAGGQLANTPKTTRVGRFDDAQLTLFAGYVMLKKGKPSPEDDSPVVERLNQILIKGNAQDNRRVLGASQPLKVDWSFVGRNLNTGEEIPVTYGREGNQGIRLEFPSAKEKANTIVRVRFPKDQKQTIYELTARATVRDAVGNLGVTEYRVWSHALRDSDRRRLAKAALTTAADVAGVSSKKLLAASTKELRPDSREISNPKLGAARAAKLSASNAAIDGRITIDELRALISAAKHFAMVRQ